MKVCVDCLVSKDELEFRPQRKSCRSCGMERQKNYRAEHPEKLVDYRKRSVLLRRDAVLRYRYGISAVDYDAMLAAQGGHCAICPATEPGGLGKFFRVDHDHETGEVRGLLCHACNLMLGYAKDDEARLMGAVKYLRASRRPKLEVVRG